MIWASGARFKAQFKGWRVSLVSKIALTKSVISGNIMTRAPMTVALTCVMK